MEPIEKSDQVSFITAIMLYSWGIILTIEVITIPTVRMTIDSRILLALDLLAEAFGDENTRREGLFFLLGDFIVFIYKKAINN